MREIKQLPKKSTLALIQEAKDAYAHFNDEAQNAFIEQLALKEKKRLLEIAKTKTDLTGAQGVILKMITELHEKIVEGDKHRRSCESSRKNYSEIIRALEAAIKEF